MSETERIRVEIAFDGTQVLSLYMPLETADEIDRALSGDRDGSVSFDADDGRYTVVLKRVVYVKRYGRESRVGFGFVAGARWHSRSASSAPPAAGRRHCSRR